MEKRENSASIFETQVEQGLVSNSCLVIRSRFGEIPSSSGGQDNFYTFVNTAELDGTERKRGRTRRRKKGALKMEKSDAEEISRASEGSGGTNGKLPLRSFFKPTEIL